MFDFLPPLCVHFPNAFKEARPQKLPIASLSSFAFARLVFTSLTSCTFKTLRKPPEPLHIN